MNTDIFRNIINLYKQNFIYIDNAERYKWRTVKCFKDNWNIEADDFSQMLHDSLALAKNLLDSGNYFPNRMIYKITLSEPESLRNLFKLLYDEDLDLKLRITEFKKSVISIFKNNFSNELNHFQDDRAIIVYLCLQYPERYFLYKYEMFKDFTELIDYHYTPRKGKIENINHYFNLCEILRTEILKDNEILEMHSKRLTSDEYFDESFNILTQDVIYAAVRHLPSLREVLPKISTSRNSHQRLILTSHQLEPNISKPTLQGKIINHLKNAEANKRIGYLGELLVIEYETEKLKRLNINKSPEHNSLNIGDGLGYDILSYDELGNEIYIEVKTTRQGAEQAFFITSNELYKSIESPSQFFLYRLFEFNDKNNSAKFYIRKGELSTICLNPTLFKVTGTIK